LHRRRRRRHGPRGEMSGPPQQSAPSDDPNPHSQGGGPDNE
jgi:hypothetical protein